MQSPNAIPAPVGTTDTTPMRRPPDGIPVPDLAGATDRGVKRERNEDYFAIAELSRVIHVRESSASTDQDARLGGGGQAVVLAVADGMGGHGAGDLASSVVVDAFMQYAAHAMPWFARGHDDDEDAMTHQLGVAVELCQRRLLRMAADKHVAALDPGTTLTAAYVAWPVMYVLHVGDSRCYLLRDGRLLQLTRDHTLAQDLLDRGVVEGEVNPRFVHVLSNAIGGGKSRLYPEIRRVELQHDDSVLLCSDGLFGQVDEDAIARTMAEAPNAQRACAQLIAMANAAGGRDNVTAVIARF